MKPIVKYRGGKSEDLEKFVSEHPNLTQKQKVYFNENISAAFGIQLYDND